VRTVVARAAAVVAAALAVALMPVTAAHAAPTVAIISPGDSVQAGVVPVHVSATGDSGVVPTSIHLQVDGTDVNGTDVPCPTPAADPPTCVLSIPWDTTGLSGAHTLTAVFTEIGGSATSTAVTITVEKVPVVSIDSPAANAAVGGAIDVGVSASTDPADNDPPSRIDVSATPLGGAAVPVGTRSCGATTCSGTIRWDPTGLDGTVTLTATVTTTNGLERSVGIAVLVESPTVAITAPLDSTKVSGNVQVSVHGASTQTTLDPLAKVELLVDGTVVDTVPCPATPNTCDVVVAWDAVAVASGAHTLAARLSTLGLLTVTSAGVHVTVTPPPATVAILTPHNKSVVRGLTAVTVTASTVPRALDHPRRIDLYVDGAFVFGRPCATTASTCRVTLGWSTRRLAGSHRITARVSTAAGGTVFSTRVYVWVYTGTVTRISRMPVVPSGRTVTVRGRVVSTVTGHGLGGAPVRFTVITGRRSYTVRGTTRSDGQFSLNVRTYVTTHISTRSSASWLSPSIAGVVQVVRAPIKCRLSSTSVKSGATGTGLCTVSALPRGTPVSLVYTFRGRTTLLARGAARGSSIPFTYRFTTRGFYTLRVVIGTSANYIATRGQPLGVTVR
jgi:hypothetical protein